MEKWGSDDLLEAMAKLLGYWFINPDIPSSTPPGCSILDSVFYPSSFNGRFY